MNCGGRQRAPSYRQAVRLCCGERADGEAALVDMLLASLERTALTGVLETDEARYAAAMLSVAMLDQLVGDSDRYLELARIVTAPLGVS